VLGSPSTAWRAARTSITHPLLLLLHTCLAQITHTHSQLLSPASRLCTPARRAQSIKEHKPRSCTPLNTPLGWRRQLDNGRRGVACPLYSMPRPLRYLTHYHARRHLCIASLTRNMPGVGIIRRRQAFASTPLLATCALLHRHRNMTRGGDALLASPLLHAHHSLYATYLGARASCNGDSLSRIIASLA